MLQLKKCIAAGFGLLVVATSLNVQAAPYFTNREGSIILDKATGLVWMRCNLGQIWNGETCQKGETYRLGSPYLSKVNAEISALNAKGGLSGFSDWRMPTARELVSLRECSNGYSEDKIDLEDGGNPVPDSCRDNSKVAIDEIAFPQPKSEWTSGELRSATRDFWTSTELRKEPGLLTIRFHGPDTKYGGYITANYHGFYQVKLVRAVKISADDALGFSVNLQDKRKSHERAAKMERDAADAKAKAAQDAANRERLAAENKRRDDKAQAIKQLIALGPRGLYIEAGKAQRNGSITFVNTNFDAGELYEMIVNKFPDSDFAVKATDQLTAMGRASRAESTARDADFSARQRAYEACKIEMNSCFSRTNGKGNCYRDCERLR